MNLSFNTALDGVGVSGIRRFSAKVRSTPGAFGLTIGEPDLNSPQAAKDAAKAALDADNTHYPPNNGFPETLKAITDFEREHHGLDYQPDEAILTIGATEALYVSLAAILNPGDEVIIPTPAFSLYESITRLCRAVPVLLPTEQNRFQIDPAALAAAVSERTKAVVLTSPNNPTGCVYTKATLDAVHEILREKPIFVICDEVYRDLIYTDSYHSFSEYKDMRDRLIVVNSFSKPYAMTGWRLGYCLADMPVHDKIKVFHQYCVVSAPAFVQPACIAALGCDIADTVKIFRRRRDYVYKRLCDMGLTVQQPEGAFYMFIDLRPFGMGSEAFCEKMLAEAKIGIIPGVYFGAEGFARLSYCYSDEELREGLDRIERFVRPLL